MSNGKIISTAFCFGSIHDFKLLLKSKTFIHPEKQVFVDSGYQGIQNIFNFQKNSWWNKKNHQPALKFDFI
ncbi:hypothetical protein [Spiroplasma endosymbiont of Zeiraphera isertana]|uniref:hypothetical protein n=1 Tax=Spiroplasma endosymbiont of Zeiraphera isertana TaxID=3066313 RepID=UPI00313BC2A8